MFVCLFVVVVVIVVDFFLYKKNIATITLTLSPAT